jgi:signal peptidase II
MRECFVGPVAKMIGRLSPLLTALLIVVADRASKLFIQHSMGAFDSVSIVPAWLRIVHTENPGGAFGVLANGNPLVRSMILIGVSALVLIFVAMALWGRSSSFHAVTARFGLALILGGAIGNLYDRILRGTVTDFIEVYHGSWSFPAFNVADSAITVGAALLLIDLLWPRNKQIAEQAGFVQK